MKVQNLNKSSQKTRKLIKTVFAEMLSEKHELGKITVSELVKRADINRGTFYSHYDDIYAVAEDYENELVENFFSNAELKFYRLVFCVRQAKRRKLSHAVQVRRFSSDVKKTYSSCGKQTYRAEPRG